MSSNYNQVVLRQLRPTLIDILEQAKAATRAVAQNEVDAEDIAGVDDTAQLGGSLDMVGCHALARLTRTLALAVESLSHAPARGWEPPHAREVAAAAHRFAAALIPQIERMADGHGALPVRLYPQWQALLTVMNEPVPTPETLFEPDPNFENEGFSRLDKTYLRNVVEGASARLAAAEQALDRATTRPALEAAVSAAAEVFQWVYQLQHRKGFQPFWLVVRARLAAALATPDELESKAALQWVLKEAHLELHRFGSDAKQVSSGVLDRLLVPLLAPWPADWAHQPVLQELRARLRLDAFWGALAHLNQPTSNSDDGETHRPDVVNAVEGLRDAWAKWIGGTGEVRTVVRAFATLLPQGQWFAQPSVTPLLQAIQAVIEWCAATPDELPDAELATEVAGGIIALEDATRIGATPADLEERLGLQTQRVRAIMVPGRPDLMRLPAVRWDRAQTQHESHEARRFGLLEAAQDLVTVEERLDEVLREEVNPSDVRRVLSDLIPPLDVGAAVLEMLKLPIHARLERALIERLDLIAGRPALLHDEHEREALALVLPALVASLRATADGQADSDEMLRPAVIGFLKEEWTGTTGEAPVWSPETAVPETPEGEDTAPALPPVVEAEHAEPTAPSSAEEPDDRAEAPNAPAPVEPPAESSPVAPTPVDGEPPIVDTFPIEESPVDDRPLSPAEPVAPPRDVAEALRSAEGWEERADRGDPDIVESFFEEATVVLDRLHLARETLLQDPDQAEAWEELRRQFHTLKGSGRFADLKGLAEVAYWLEHHVAEAQEAHVPYTLAFDSGIEAAAHWVTQALDDLQVEGSVWLHAADLWALLHGGVSISPAQDIPAPEEPDYSDWNDADLPPFDLEPVEGLSEEASTSEEPAVPRSDETEVREVFDAIADSKTAAPAAPEAPRSALAEFIADPQSREAIEEEWRRRTADLANAEQGQDAETLGRAAHTLRTVAAMFGWDAWERECIQVEGAIEAGEPVNITAWTARWTQAIAQIQAGGEPSVVLDGPLQLEQDHGNGEGPFGEAVVARPAPSPAEWDAIFEAPESPTEEAIWNEVFSAFEALMDGGRRLGRALEQLAAQDKARHE
jgi:chemosensory pili system protein ChpA (sensor histidine kinase/response regulator)